MACLSRHWEEALSYGRAKISSKPNQSGKLAGLGGNPLTVEENYLFQKLMREGAESTILIIASACRFRAWMKKGCRPEWRCRSASVKRFHLLFFWDSISLKNFLSIWLRLKQAINHGAKVVFYRTFCP